MLSVWVIPVFSFRVATATNITAFTRRPSARSRLAAVSASSTIRTLHTGFPSPSRAATRLCLSSPRCARYGWVLWRAGALSTTDKMSLALHAGLRFTSTDHYIGSIKCWQRWAPHTTPSHQYHNVFTACVKICPLFNFFIDNLVKNQQFWTLIFGMHNQEKFREVILNLSTTPEKMSPLYLVKCRIWLKLCCCCKKTVWFLNSQFFSCLAKIIYYWQWPFCIWQGTVMAF